MIKKNKFKRNLRKNRFRKKGFNKNKNIVNKVLIQFIISCIIVLLAFGTKLNIYDSQRYTNQVKTVLEYNMDFKEYSNVIHKKVTEVLKIYDQKGELR
ncbi:hypothetical protein [Tepidibacter aestuarii]|uniref:hypothetical protein n=1 Tax=Tepidibacter aestuarii TaxID=2925782 RepID=UPI0020BE8272|nr:hypothetical protein [Tepidibacter aestuarii]CAH2214188.1 conserved protein of unknown function [Tepidibacter aestuarii]